MTRFAFSGLFLTELKWITIFQGPGAGEDQLIERGNKHGARLSSVRPQWNAFMCGARSDPEPTRDDEITLKLSANFYVCTMCCAGVYPELNMS